MIPRVNCPKGGDTQEICSTAMTRCLPSWLALGLAVFALGCGGGPEARLEEVHGLQDAGDFAATLAPLRELLDATPDDPELNHLYGLALLQTRQPELAIWPLRKAARHPDRAIEDGLLLTQALLRGGSAHDAVQQASRVLELDPDRIGALRLLVDAKVAARTNEEALIDIERLLTLAPDDMSALMSRLVALLNLDRVDEAEQALAAVRASAEALPAPNEWQPRLCAATAAFAKEKGDPDAAEVLWNDCLERFPSDEIIVFGGVEFFDERSQPRRSLEILSRAQETEPSHLLFIQARASRLAALGRSVEAERLLLAAAQGGVNESQAWLGLANYYEQQDEPAKARDALAQGLKMMDEAPPALTATYVELLIRAGDYAEADERIAGLEHEPVMANLLRGRLLLARGEPAEALEALDAGLQLWPDNSVARLLAGQAAEQLGDYERALAEYREAARNEPGNRDAVFNLLRWFEALDLSEEALPILARYQRERPRDPEGLVLAIRFASRADRKGLVQRLVQRLSEIPGQAGVLATEVAAIRAATGGPAAGIDSIRAAGLDLSRPQNRSALGALVLYLVADGRPEEALESIQPALAVRPNDALLHELRGRALRAAGATASAREALRRALELEPELAAALAELAALTAEQGDRATAITLYDRAAGIEPEQPAHAWAAIQLLTASDRGAAVERRLEVLLARHPNHAGAADLMARRLLARDPGRALELARRAVRSGGGADALETLGRVLLERGDAEGAVQALGLSLEQRPDSPSTRYWHGRALAAAGDENGARLALRAALMTGAFPEREAAQAELARLEAH
jgi:tetratricopeptide (TPR) repeat protein